MYISKLGYVSNKSQITDPGGSKSENIIAQGLLNDFPKLKIYSFHGMSRLNAYCL